MLEQRILLTTVDVNTPGELYVDLDGDDTYRFLPSFQWDETTIIGNPETGRDTLDFSQLTSDLTFRIKAGNEVVVTDGDKTTSALYVEEYLAGQAKNVFIVERGAEFDEGAIIGNSALGSETIVSFSENYENPDSGKGFGTRVEIGLANTSLPQVKAKDVRIDTLTSIDEVVGGRGKDELVGDDQDNRMRGGQGGDTIAGGDGADTLIGDAGKDRIEGGPGNDPLLDGGSGADTILGGTGNDVVVGGDGADLLIGGADADVLRGGAGSDTLHGDADPTSTDPTVTGSDSLFGNQGDDVYVFATGWGQDDVTEHAGEGKDTLDFQHVQADITFDIGGVEGSFIVATVGDTTHRVDATNHIEKIIGAHGTTPNNVTAKNTYNILDEFAETYDPDGFFNKTLVIENKLEDNRLPNSTLNLSDITEPVKVIVSKLGRRNGNRVTVTFTGQDKKLVIDNVADIVGSQANDEFVIEKGGRLVGRLDGGGGDQNRLHYVSTVPDTIKQGEVLSADDEALIPSSASSKKGVHFTIAPDNYPAIGDAIGQVPNQVVGIQIVAGGSRRDAVFGDAAGNVLEGGKEADLLVGHDGNDTLRGDGGDDQLRGGNGQDLLEGGGGNDILLGGLDIDELNGGWGDDTLNGGPGSDVLRGGGGPFGKDVFQFTIDQFNGADVGWGLDTIEAGRLESRDDTLDFSQVDRDINYTFKSSEIVAQTAATGDPSEVTVKSPVKIATLKTGMGAQTLKFGNKWGSITIDHAALAVANAARAGDSQQKLTLDFGDTTIPLRFTVSENSGNTSLLVEKLDFLNRTRDLIPVDFIPGTKTTRVVIPIVDANVTVITGSNDNFYRVKGDASFPGELQLKAGPRFSQFPPLTELFIPSGLRVVHALDVSGGLASLGPHVADLTTGEAGTAGLLDVLNPTTLGELINDAFDPTFSNPFAGKISAVKGFDNLAASSGFPPPNFNSVSYGTGINLLRGDAFNNTFKHRSLRPGVHILSGLQGADTYSFSTLWGAAFVVEKPDLKVGGEPIPEFLDTLDFSAVTSNIVVDVYEFGLVKDTIGTLVPGLDFSDIADLSTNLVIAKADDPLGNTIFDQFGFHPFDAQTSMVVATDIESLVGPSIANMTVRLHGDASLRGTVNGGSKGTVTLDYSQYGSSVTVDTTRRLESLFPDAELPGFVGDAADSVFQVIASGDLLAGGGTGLTGLEIDKPTAIGSATGIIGHRLGGATTLLDLTNIYGEENSISQTIAKFAVSGLTEVIGSPHADRFIAGENNPVTFPTGDPQDQLDNEIGRLDLFQDNGTSGAVVNMIEGTFKRGDESRSSSGLLEVVSGRGNDEIIGNSGNNTFFFKTRNESDGSIVGWGVDTITGGGGRDLLDFSEIPEDWDWAVRDPVDNESFTEIYFLDANDKEQSHKVLLKQEANSDFRIKDRNAFPTGGVWNKVEFQLSTDSLVSAALSVDGMITSVPDTVVEAAIRQFDGKTIQVPTTDGTATDDFSLRVEEVTDGNSIQSLRLLNDRDAILVDSATLPILVMDLPDRQLSSRLLSGEILIDATAGDHGWFTDLTSNLTTTVPDDRVDLTSVIVHELAQRLSLDAATNVMLPSIEVGVARRDVPDTVTTSLSSDAVNDTALEVATLPDGAISELDAIQAVIEEAVDRWNDASVTAIGSGTQSTVAPPRVELTDLPDAELARTLPDGTILLDPTAAGHGWFVDETPTMDDDDVPADKMDLLTVLMHELGHSLGLGHDAEAGASDLMDAAIVAGRRLTPPSGLEAVTLDSTDQSKLNLGLEAFAGWVEGLGEKLNETLASSVDVPFLGGVSLAGLFGLDEAMDDEVMDGVTMLTQGLHADIIHKVADVFGAHGDLDTGITNQDIALQPNIEFAPSSNLVAYVATVDLAGMDFDRQYDLDFANLSIGGVDPASLGLKVTSQNPPTLNVHGGADLRFIFGLDPSGQFYVDTPELVASLSIDSGDEPFDIAVGLGPGPSGLLGLSVDQGRVEIAGEMTLGTDTRLTYETLVNQSFDPSQLLPVLGGGAAFNIDLPMSLTGALEGLSTEGFGIHASGEFAPTLGSLGGLLDVIEFDTPGFDDLLALRGISLDQILDAVIAGLDSLVQEDSLIYQKIPGLNRSAVDLFGDGTDDFILSLKNAVESVRGGNLGTLETDLNTALNHVLGAAVNPVSLVYENSTLLLDLSFEKVLAGATVAFQVDLHDLFLDDLQSFIDASPLKDAIKLDALNVTIGDDDGNIALGVEGTAGVEFGFGFDLGNVLDPVTFFTDDSQVFVALEAGTAEPLDIDVSLELGELGTVGFSIADATADLRLSAAYGLEDNDEGSYELSAITGDDLSLSFGGSAAIDLPLYLTDQIPVGGTTEDLNADGFPDNVVHIGAELEAGEFEFEIAAPGMDQLLGLAALLNDPETVLQGLEAMFAGLEGDLAEKFSALDLPLVEDALQDAAGFVAELRDDVLGIKDPNNGKYSDGRLGQKLQDASDSGESVIDLVKEELFNALKNVEGETLLRVPKVDANDNLVFDADGKLELVPIESAEDIGITITEDAVQFNVLIADTILHKDLPLSFDASAPGLGLSTSGDTGLSLDLSYVMGLGIGLSATDLVYLDTSGVTESGAELALNLEVTVDPNSKLEGQLGFLRVMLEEEEEDADGPSGLFGEIEVDLQDKGGDGRWSLLTEGLDVTARLTAAANADLSAAVDIPPILFGDVSLEFPKLDTLLHYDQVFADVELGGTGGTSSTSFGEAPVVVFEDVTLDLGQFITGFAAPLVEKVADVTGPLAPIVELLTKDIKLLKDLGASATSLLDIAAVALGPTKFAPTVRAIEAIEDVVTFINDIDEFVKGDDPSIMVNFGTFTVGGDLREGQGSATPPAGPGTSVEDEVDNSGATEDKKQKTKKVLDNIGTTKGSFQFPLLAEPLQAFNLLLGKPADLFLYDLPGLALDFNYVKSFPVFPGLNARFGGGASATTSFSFGFDTSGIEAWKDAGFAPFDVGEVLNGFFLDDGVSFSGDTYKLTDSVVDAPEISLGATIVAGASVGVAGLVEAGVEGGIIASIGFDLNDLPEKGTGKGTDKAAEFDGKLRGNELVSRLDQGVECLFDTQGALSAFLDAFFWIGADLGFFGKVTIFEARKNFLNETLASFDFSCPDPEPPTLATQEGDVVTLKYLPADGTITQGERFFVDQLMVPVDPQDPQEEHERIRVSSRGFVADFDPTKVKTIKGSGTRFEDRIIISENVMANVELRGGDGNDFLQVDSTSNDFTRTLFGDDGDDMLVGNDGSDILHGGSGKDMLSGGGGTDVIHGDGGNDMISGGDGPDRIWGGDGKDVILGDAGDDEIYGEADADRIEGGPGADVIRGGDGDDFLEGNEGSDVIEGQVGDDTITGGPDPDTLRGGDGADTFQWFSGDGSDLVVDGGASERAVNTDEDGEVLDEAGEGTGVFLPVGTTLVQESDTVKLFAKAGIVNENLTFTRNDLDVEVSLEDEEGVQQTDLTLKQVQRVIVDLGEGSDTVTVNDLAGSTVGAIDVDFGQGEVLETVTITEDRAEENVLDGEEVVSLVEVPSVFATTAPFDPNTFTLEQFQRQTHEGGLYQVDSEGSPVLVDLVDQDGEPVVDPTTGVIRVQQNVGGVPQFDSGGSPVLEQVETRSIQRSKQIALPVFDDAGNPVLEDPTDSNSPQLTEVFITPEFGIDSQKDILHLFGSPNGDDVFDVTNDEEMLSISQDGGPTFSVINSMRADDHTGDEVIIETLGGDDTVRTGEVNLDLLSFTLITGEGNDTLVGTPFDDVLDSGAGNDTVTGGVGVDLFLDAGGEDTLIERRDANFLLTDTQLVTTTLTFEETEPGPLDEQGNPTVVPAPRQELVSEDEALDNLFETVRLFGYDDVVGNDKVFSINQFTVRSWTHTAFLDGGQAGDTYNITLSGSSSSEVNSTIFIDEDKLGVVNFGIDQVNVFGTNVADTFVFNADIVERLAPRPGDSGEGSQFNPLTEFSTETIVRDTTVSDAFRQIVNYLSAEHVFVSGRDGDDLFLVDDSSTELFVDGAAGDDRFFIGNVRSTKEFVDPKLGLIDVVDEITNGVSFPAEFHGGTGNDYFEVNHNIAEISLFGEDGDDTFFLQAHLTVEPEAEDNFIPSEEINVHSEEGQRDILSYVKNAPVNIFGGAGFDTLVVVGTVLDDTFTIFVEEVDGKKVQRIFGAGLIVPRIEGIEKLLVLTGSGDDVVNLYGTLDDQEIRINTGSGNDTVLVGGEALDFDVVVPESRFTKILRIPQPDIVSTDTVLARPGYYKPKVTYAVNIFGVRLFPQYSRVWVPPVFKDVELRTPQPDLLIPRVVTVPEFVLPVFTPETRALNTIQGPVLIDGLTRENILTDDGQDTGVLGDDRIVFDNRFGEQTAGSMVRRTIENVSLETNLDALAGALPSGVAADVIHNTLVNKIRDLHRIRQAGLVDTMLADLGGFSGITLSEKTVINHFVDRAAFEAFAAEQGFTTTFEPEFDEVEGRNINRLRAQNEPGQSLPDFEIEVDYDLDFNVTAVRVLIVEPLTLSVPHGFVTAKILDDVQTLDTISGFGTGNGIFYENVNLVELHLSNQNDLLTIEDTLLGSTTSVFGNGGDDEINVKTISGPTHLLGDVGPEYSEDYRDHLGAIGLALELKSAGVPRAFDPESVPDIQDLAEALNAEFGAGIDVGAIAQVINFDAQVYNEQIMSLIRFEVNALPDDGNYNFELEKTGELLELGRAFDPTNEGDLQKLAARLTSEFAEIDIPLGLSKEELETQLTIFQPSVWELLKQKSNSIKAGKTFQDHPAEMQALLGLDDTFDPHKVSDVQKLVALLNDQFNLPVAPESIAFVPNLRLDDFRSEIWRLLTAKHGLVTVPTGNDTITVRDDGGTAHGIRTRLTLDGQAGYDTVNVWDASDAADNVGTLTSSSLTGLGMGSDDPDKGIGYVNIDELNIDLGAGHDVINIQGTSALTNVNLHDGDERIYVSSLADLTLANSTDFLPGDLDDVGGTLNIEAGEGRHLLMISDEAATAGDANVVITDDVAGAAAAAAAGLNPGAEIAVTGLAPAAITFGADPNTGNFFEGIRISAGAGADHLHVDGTHRRPGARTTTLLNTGFGDDVVEVDLDKDTDGFFVLHTQGGANPLDDQEGTLSDNDVVDASASTLPLVIFGGLGDDAITGGMNDDLIFGDFGRVQYFDAAGALIAVHGFGGPGDLIDSQIVAAKHAFSVAYESGGADTLAGGPGQDVLVGGASGDMIDGGAEKDLLLGDHVSLDRQGGQFQDFSNPRFRTLMGQQIYGEVATGAGANDGQALVDRAHQYEDPHGAPRWGDWAITLLEPSAQAELDGGNASGADYLAGGPDRDAIFGQLGDDVIQGDGSIDSALQAAGSTVGARRLQDGTLQVTPSIESDDDDGDDYVEGNGGNDVIFGNLGQDDLIGGSSEWYGLAAHDQRPDGRDLIFGGAGTVPAGPDDGRNHSSDPSDDGHGHGRDADVILGDNGNIFRLVSEDGTPLNFAYDDLYGEQLVVRAAELLDYTPGGLDFVPGSEDNGAGDEIHGESGDDVIYGMTGNDVLFGEGQDDDLIGGWGHDWFSGGTGEDGVLGDDGRIYTSRVSDEFGEPLYGIAAFDSAELNKEISTPGDIQQSIVNIPGQLKKTVNLTPFNVHDPTATGIQDPSYQAQFADDVIYGGLGTDFLHGGSGDDALSGAEALARFYMAPANPGNALRFGEVREGEFAAYDEFNPRHRIFVDSSGTFTDATSDGATEFLLNFDATEGPDVDGVMSDGDDRLFGGLGNDWLVGGTGQDHLYGGRGDDLLNADDDHDTGGGLNDTPDTHTTYEDIAFGGAGRDVLIANTGGDRLIDWVGEFNSYLVPFAPFGPFTISRAPQPQLAEYVIQRASSDGADPTRAADTGNDPARNGEPDGELGVVIQKDPEWQNQTGAPADPQPGNIPGGPRDVLRGADFNNGSAQGFTPDSGTWQVTGARLEVAPEILGGDAVSVFYVDDYLPSYFELTATINAGKPTGGYKSNAYLIFDYQGPTDFKFAGVNVSTNKLEMGHRDATGWYVDQQTNLQVNADQDYHLLLALNGVTATLVVDGSDVFSHAFPPRVDADGFSYNLNAGMVGIGADNSISRIDNVAVQVLPPEITLEETEDFTDGVADRFVTQTGQWLVTDGRYEGVPASGDLALSTVDLQLASSSQLEIEASLRTSAVAGLVFDWYAVDDFKFVALSPATDEVLIGYHSPRHGWQIEATAPWSLTADSEYQVNVTLVGTTASVIVNGQAVLGYGFNAPLLDGEFGVMARDGGVSIDAFLFRTNDPAYEDEGD